MMTRSEELFETGQKVHSRRREQPGQGLRLCGGNAPLYYKGGRSLDV